MMHGSSTVALLGPVASLRLCSSSLLAQLGFTVGTEEVTFLRAGVGSLDRSEVFLHRVHERVPVLAMLREVPHAEQKGKEKRAGAVEVVLGISDKQGGGLPRGSTQLRGRRALALRGG